MLQKSLIATERRAFRFDKAVGQLLCIIIGVYATFADVMLSGYVVESSRQVLP